MLSRSTRVLAVLACSGGCMTPGVRRSTMTTSAGDLLTYQELSAIAGTTQNAYSAVERLRPLFLSVRPSSAYLDGRPRRIYVFINGNFAGDVDALKTLSIAAIESIQRVTASAAYIREGQIRSGDGVLLIRLRR